MFKISYISLILLIFAAGWLSGNLYQDYTSYTLEEPSFLGFLLSTSNLERASPYDHISENNIHVFRDEIKLDIQDAQWSSFTDTNSMDPFLDAGANGIEISPTSENDIHIGDVISYEPDFTDGIVIHRVIRTGNDNQGWYAITKGDNNPSNDPGKVRFNQINGILVAIVY
jgi:hypothetical protein